MAFSNTEIIKDIIEDIIQKALDNESTDAIFDTNTVALTSNGNSKIADRFDVKENYNEVASKVAENDNDGMESCFTTELVNPSQSIIESDSGEIKSEIGKFTEWPTVDKFVESCDSNGSITTDNNGILKTDIRPTTSEMGVKDVTLKENTESTYYSDELLGSLGFNRYIYDNAREIANLHLMLVARQFNECKIRFLDLPPEMKENELIPLFEKYGPVYKLKKIIDRNLVFVTYTNAEDAQKAVKALHCSVFRGRKILAFEVFVEGQLFVKGIPKYAKKDDIFRRFSAITNTLEKVSLFNDPIDHNRNRGFCFLQYHDRKQAENARKILMSKVIFGKHLLVDFPQRRYNSSDNHTIFIHNLRKDMRPNDLRKHFSVYGELSDAHINGNFAFVRFQKSEDAACAARDIDKRLLGNENVEISTYQIGERKVKKTLPNSSDATAKKIVKAPDSSDATEKKIIKKTRSNSSDTSTLNVKNLRSDLSTSDLRKYFSIYGAVKEIDKDDTYASIRFRHSDNAKQAAREINKSELGPNVEISLLNPQKKKIPKSDTLYISNLQSSFTTMDLRKIFSVYGDVIELDKDGKFATVRYRNMENARRAYNEVDKKQLGHGVEISLKKMVQATSVTLCIKNLRSTISTSELRQYFAAYGPIAWIDKDGTNASVRFQDIESADRAVHGIDKKLLGNVTVSLI